MTILNKKISVEYLFRVLFHVLFWGVWVMWPIINAYLNDTDRDRWYLANIAPLSLTHVPQFFINTHILMPYFLRRKGVGSYVFSVIVLSFVFAIIQYSFKLVLWHNGQDMYGHDVKFFDFKTIFPILFVSAISTVYGLIIYMAD